MVVVNVPEVAVAATPPWRVAVGTVTALMTDVVPGVSKPLDMPASPEAAANLDRRRAWAGAGQQTILERNDHQVEMHKMETLYAEAANAAR